MKKYILIAGVNGAGKSTLYQTVESLKDMPRINTDEIVKSFGSWQNMADVFKAGKIAVKKMKEYFENGITFNQETTLCGVSSIQNIKLAKSLGYKIELHYVGVASVEIAKERISYRVSKGGHGIPNADVERRYTESFMKLKEIISLCDLAVLYDNTEIFNRFAIYKEGKIFDLAENRPDWYDKLNI